MVDILDPKTLNLGTRPVISEAILKNILPSFVENMRKPVGEQDQSAYKKIYDIVKTEYSRIDIVDESGDVLFWMPQLRYTPEFSTGDLSGFHNYAEAVARRSPKKADVLVNDVLSETLLNVNIPEEDIKQWAIILERYGYSVPDKHKADAKATDEKVQGNDSFEIDEADDDQW